MFDFLKTSDFARAAVYGFTALGVVIDPAQIEAIVAGGFALSALIHSIRAAFKNKK